MIRHMDFTPKNQYVISQNIVTAMKNPNVIDLKGMLELLHTHKDVNVQVKLFSTLSAYLMSNEVDIDLIITHNSLYDKVCEILSHCPPSKAIVVFNFLSALLYTDNEGIRRNSLIVYAKNMLRSSGCLATMCELFTSSMMHQDAWRSLCRCLAESCQGIEANQSYCTHLVPLCVQRCSQRNIEVFLVLQSLLQNHARNASLFLESNGISLFLREYLQHDVCLQLLNTLVQSSAQAVELVNKTDVGQHLHDFLQLYGPQSQLGQWATIILYRISGSIESREMFTVKKQAIKDRTIDKSVIPPRPDDSTRFIQNVMKEIQLCAPSDLKYLQGLFPVDILSEKTHACKQQGVIQNKLQSQVLPQKQNIRPSFQHYNFENKRCLNNNDLIQNVCRQNSKMELSFSFLQKQFNEMSSNVTMTANKITESFQTFPTHSMKTGKVSDSLLREDINRQETPDLSNFEPKFVSTPKRYDLLESNKTIRHYRTNHRRSILNTVTKHEPKRKIRRQRIASRSVRTPKRLEQTTIVKENKRGSVSSWFFGAVNESCTNLYKTVRNIFKPKKCQQETNTKSSPSMSVKDAGSCSYSFTNYMRKRDAILKSEKTKTSTNDRDEFSEFSMELSDSCNTCNNTMALKQKLVNDDHLKQTVRKLKLGINLYGCDFKKISKQLWPQQSYMTPVVLYNLYRKLIIK